MSQDDNEDGSIDINDNNSSGNDAPQDADDDDDDEMEEEERSFCKKEDVDDDDDDDDENDQGEEKEGGISLGGNIYYPAFALLVGMEDQKDGSLEKCQFPVTRLPVTLGRSHNTNDPNFVPLGSSKALSRNHCLIYYRDVAGGRLGQYGDLDVDELVYQPPAKKRKEDDDGDDDEDDDEDDDGEQDVGNIIMPSGKSGGRNNDDDEDSDNDDDNNESKEAKARRKKALLPQNGFFAIECLGKNKIIVGGKTVLKGQVAVLDHGTTLQLASLQLYFLLPPKRNKFDEGLQTIEVPNPAHEIHKKKLAKLDKGKRRPGTLPPPKLPSAGGLGGLHSELEGLSIETLLDRMTDAIRANQWDRRHQMLGSAISLYAVRDSARSRHMRDIARKEGGVTRGDVMKWISSSSLYENWVPQMLSKMEIKSYQSNIGKALIKARFERTGTTGRHVRWTLPKDIMEEVGDQDDADSAANDSDDGSDDEEDDDDDDNNASASDDDDGSDDDSAAPADVSAVADSSDDDDDDDEEEGAIKEEENADSDDHSSSSSSRDSLV